MAFASTSARHFVHPDKLPPELRREAGQPFFKVPLISVGIANRPMRSTTNLSSPGLLCFPSCFRSSRCCFVLPHPPASLRRPL